MSDAKDKGKPALFVSIALESWGELRCLVYVVRTIKDPDTGKWKVRNLRSDEWASDKLDDLDGFVIKGHGYKSGIETESPAVLIGLEPTFRDVYQIDLRAAKRMVRVHQKWERFSRKLRDDAMLQSHQDYFRALAKFCGAKTAIFADYTKGEGAPRSHYDENDWTFEPLSVAVESYDKFVQRVLADTRPL